jgi:parallel beta-helix repeat protein
LSCVALRVPTPLLAVAIVLAFLAIGAPGASAAPPVCVDLPSGGQAALVVTKDTTLDSDIPYGCQAGIEIAAPGITLDLAGHKVAGRDYGIRNAGHDGVTIRNGSVEGDVAAVGLIGVERNVVRDVAASTLLGSAIRLSDSDRNRILFTDTAGYREGIGLHEGSDRNGLYGNNDHGSLYGGVRIDSSNRNRIVRNVITLGEPTGLLLTNAHRNLIAGNRVLVELSEGIRLERSDGNLVVRNRVADRQPGQFEIPPVGISLAGSRGNRVGRNTVTQAIVGLQLAGGSRNLLASNRTFANSGDGIVVDSVATRSLLLYNRAWDNGDDGLDVESPSTRLIANRARDNVDLGIEAVAGVFARANRASGNGNPAQCLNVRCR